MLTRLTLEGLTLVDKTDKIPQAESQAKTGQAKARQDKTRHDEVQQDEPPEVVCGCGMDMEILHNGRLTTPQRTETVWKGSMNVVWQLACQAALGLEPRFIKDAKKI